MLVFIRFVALLMLALARPIRALRVLRRIEQEAATEQQPQLP